MDRLHMTGADGFYSWQFSQGSLDLVRLAGHWYMNRCNMFFFFKLVGGCGRCCHIISRIIANLYGSIANDLSFDLGRRRTKLTYYYHVSFVTSFSTMPCPGETKELEAWLEPHCTLCVKVFNSITQLNRHEKTMHSAQPWRC